MAVRSRNRATPKTAVDAKAAVFCAAHARRQAPGGAMALAGRFVVFASIDAGTAFVDTKESADPAGYLLHGASRVAR